MIELVEKYKVLGYSPKFNWSGLYIEWMPSEDERAESEYIELCLMYRFLTKAENKPIRNRCKQLIKLHNNSSIN